MIARLTGSLIERAPNHVLIDVGGVGYEVRISLATFYALASHDGEPVSVWTYTHVREDVLALYGFHDLAEKEMFERLIAISGVGPRIALAILSGIGVTELHLAVRQQDRARLERIPGVGKKTAARLLLELRDKLLPKDVADDAERAALVAADGSETGLHADARSALVNLGYQPAVADRAVAKAAAGQGEDASLESLLKAALRGLMR
jgi:Holliday junction DNA helicase RuvA